MIFFVFPFVFPEDAESRKNYKVFISHNEVRPHQKLHNLTPNEFELKYYEQNK